MRTPFLHPASSFEELWSEVDFATMEIPERFNLGVACVDDQDPDAWALTVVAKDESSVSYTFGEVRRSNRLANGLAGLGVQRGDVVAIVNPASLETAVPSWPSSGWGPSPCRCRRCSAPTPSATGCRTARPGPSSRRRPTPPRCARPWPGAAAST